MKPTKFQVSPDLVIMNHNELSFHLCHTFCLSISFFIHIKLASINPGNCFAEVLLHCRRHLEGSCTKMHFFMSTLAWRKRTYKVKHKLVIFGSHLFWWISKLFLQFSNWDFNRKANFSGLSVFITKFNVSYVSLTEETEKNEIYSDLSAVEKKTLLHCRSLYPEIWKKNSRYSTLKSGENFKVKM